MTRTRLALVLALLLVLLIAATNSSGAFEAATGVESRSAAFEGGDPASCYTIDTSRPEWLTESPLVYLPVVLRDFEP
jgi:hypothetical protein